MEGATPLPPPIDGEFSPRVDRGLEPPQPQPVALVPEPQPALLPEPPPTVPEPPPLRRAAGEDGRKMGDCSDVTGLS